MEMAMEEAGAPPELPAAPTPRTSTELNDRIETRLPALVFNGYAYRLPGSSSALFPIGHPQGACAERRAWRQPCSGCGRRGAPDDQSGRSDPEMIWTLIFSTRHDHSNSSTRSPTVSHSEARTAGTAQNLRGVISGVPDQTGNAPRGHAHLYPQIVREFLKSLLASSQSTNRFGADSPLRPDLMSGFLE